MQERTEPSKSETASSGEPDRSGLPNGDPSSKRIFEDPAIAEALNEDPLFRFLSEYWKQVLLIVGAVFVFIYGKGVYQDTYTSSMRHAGDLFASLRSEYAKYEGLVQEHKKLASAAPEVEEAANEVEGDAKKDAQKLAEVKENLSAAEERVQELIKYLSESRPPYTSISKIYAGLVARQKGELGELRAALSGFDWMGVSESNSVERFYSEVAALVMARALVDDEESYQKSRGLLAELAKDGEHVDVSAALTLARISLTEDEKSQARGVLESVVSNHPEQAALLESELKRLRS